MIKMVDISSGGEALGDQIPKLKVFSCKCLRCGHEWVSRKAKIPRACAKCKRISWNREIIYLKRGRPAKKKDTDTTKGAKNIVQDNVFEGCVSEIGQEKTEKQINEGENAVNSIEISSKSSDNSIKEDEISSVRETETKKGWFKWR